MHTSATFLVPACLLMFHISLFQKQISDLKSENDTLNEKLKSEEQKRISREKANLVSHVCSPITIEFPFCSTVLESIKYSAAREIVWVWSLFHSLQYAFSTVYSGFFGY